jgi:XTP/dITP diphosphohydrolase
MVAHFSDIKKLLIATHNDGKAKEIKALLSPYIGDFATSGELGLSEPEEKGSTFAENAIIKAVESARQSGLPALADDSGLSVTALGGEPGIFSARWAGPERDFNMAMEKVNNELGDTKDRSASFICVLALALPEGEVETFEGRVDGDIIWPQRGNNGFGYDPVFIPRGFDRTFAEMSADEKYSMSHRSNAFKCLIDKAFARN